MHTCVEMIWDDSRNDILLLSTRKFRPTKLEVLKREKRWNWEKTNWNSCIPVEKLQWRWGGKSIPHTAKFWQQNYISLRSPQENFVPQTSKCWEERRNENVLEIIHRNSSIPVEKLRWRWKVNSSHSEILTAKMNCVTGHLIKNEPQSVWGAEKR